MLAIDPGVTTGLAWTQGPHPLTDYTRDIEAVWAVVAQGWDMVVVERFTTSGRISKYGIHTAQLVGGITALCWAKSIPLLVVSPQHRYPYQEQAASLLASTKHVIHECDALAHLLCYLELGK